MYLATGLGVDVVPGADRFPPNFDDKEVDEEYYRKMVKEFPTHPLLLRNYAEFLKVGHPFPMSIIVVSLITPAPDAELIETHEKVKKLVLML